MKIRHTLAAATALVAAAVAIVPTVASADHGSRTATYRVTIENIATGFQPLSPSGAVVHGRWTDVWNTGSPSTAAVAAVAEDANLGVFVDTYAQTPGVSQSFVGGDAPFGPGGSATFEFEARRGQRLSLVNMLVNTNDAFTGLDSVKLRAARTSTTSVPTTPAPRPTTNSPHTSRGPPGTARSCAILRVR